MSASLSIRYSLRINFFFTSSCSRFTNKFVFSGSVARYELPYPDASGLIPSHEATRVFRYELSDAPVSITQLARGYNLSTEYTSSSTE